ncbi:MAG TPA: type I 3-dehydroquinate dehydratase [Chthoniobacterales bacterium]|jgi:3-dehydroquinate dehydratase-1|nr:type I 3-dehydroquinate dehydratase [Chthoniobacterales bacterium]
MTPASPRIVGVVFSLADLRRATEIRNPPDLFELRLDGLVRSLDAVKRQIQRLRAPIIITARHPQEGGAHDLSTDERRALLLEFLEHAAHVDIEMRSLRFFSSVLLAAAASGIPTIVSFHDLYDTPTPARLKQLVVAARAAGADIVKIATRTHTQAQLKRLVAFVDGCDRRARVAAMGIGKLGRVSRVEFARRGSALHYAHLGTPRAPGQLSVAEARRLVRGHGVARAKRTSS